MDKTMNGESIFAQNKVTIRPVELRDKAAWLTLWNGYNTFYNVSLPDAVTEENWAHILDPLSPVKALLAVDGEDEALGLAHYILHPSTWSTRLSCYLEDLFVLPEARRCGVGRALIERLVVLSQERGWNRLYWMTREDNTTARSLYDSFCQADGFVRYVLRFE